MKRIRVTIWNENVHERSEGAFGDLVRGIYPDGIHNAIREGIASDDFDVSAVSLDMPSQGLPDDLLAKTDVLFWWGHIAHDKVDDALVDRIQRRVFEGMGLVVLHSGHYAKIFKRLLGTPCSLRWRELGERERVWVVDRAHPIAQGLPESFSIPHTEMYGEPFMIPPEAHVVFMSWYEGGNVLRSGVTFERGAGKVFYFAPGHESFPIYRQPEILKILANAARWAAPAIPPQKADCWDMDPPPEEVRTKDPTKGQ